MPERVKRKRVKRKTSTSPARGSLPNRSENKNSKWNAKNAPVIVFEMTMTLPEGLPIQSNYRTK
jgi:hypothetical protein